ncbi:hypothetical protein G3M48_004231 [Beauveria asiatica]|uniref:Uncharacterized protein n=1 Tax=Beauveria asiatica TaxID=1069075 RepID=A0AAW0RUH4_9HYPO
MPPVSRLTDLTLDCPLAVDSHLPRVAAQPLLSPGQNKSKRHSGHVAEASSLGQAPLSGKSKRAVVNEKLVLLCVSDQQSAPLLARSSAFARRNSPFLVLTAPKQT